MNNTDKNNPKQIQLNCLNVRGLRNNRKRLSIFTWLKQMHPGITLLQETHSAESDTKKWQNEWGGDIFFSHGEYNARGVAILIPQQYQQNVTPIDFRSDSCGRMIMLKCKIETTIYIILNIYSPTKDNLKEQLQFSKYLRVAVEEYSGENLLLGGDLNTYLNIAKDKKGGRQEKNTEYTNCINAMCNEFKLIDIWRIRNPDKLTFTRQEKSRSGLVQSRLDYWLVSENLSYLITKQNIKPSIHTDHSLITIILSLQNTHQRGKGLWKFNNNLLNDTEYVKNIKSVISETIRNTHYENKNMLWEYMKCIIRSHTIEYSIQKSKKDKETEQDLIKKLTNFELLNDPTDIDYDTYCLNKREYEHFIDKKTKGIIVRSKAEYVEQGEKNTKYFLNLEKRNYEIKHIKTLLNEQNIEITDPNDILQEEKQFYEILYKSTHTKHITFSDYCNNDSIPKLDETSKSLINQPISIEECTNAMKQLPNNKSPGQDGFTTNFYKFFWIDLKDILLESYKYSYEQKNLTQSQKLGVLNLIPKEGKDIRLLSNWRPISLLNTDYKILTKVLAMRLQKVIPNLINGDQVGYIKGRYIGQNIRSLFDIIQYANDEQIEGYIAQIDFQKAFDSVEWDFLHDTLDAFNLGNYFNTWIKIIYTDISSCVTNNGFISNFFKLSRAIRQGCPVSALLFLFVAEVIAIQIRNNKEISGIKLNDHEYKILLMADDTTLCLSNISSLHIAIKEFLSFEKFSGLKLNLSKTEIIPIGSKLNQNIITPIDLSTVKIKHLPFKALGTWFYANEIDCMEYNTKKRIENMNTILNIWRCRNLSIKGKIVIIKSLVLPQITFLFSMLYITDSILIEIEKMLYNFIWDFKPAKIKKKHFDRSNRRGGSCNA